MTSFDREHPDNGSLLDANLKLLQKRWPHLSAVLQETPSVGECRRTDTPAPTISIDGIQLSSGYNRTAEAALQASLVPQDAVQAWVYGIGSGDLVTALLQRESLEKLQVVLLSPAIAATSFAYFDHRRWLADPRVNLLTATAVDGLQRPFAAVPACLQLADDGAARLRDLVVLELATPFIRQRHGADNAQLMARLHENRDHCQRDGDAAALLGSQRGKTVLIAGAGPTLADSFARIKQWQQAGRPLLAVGSALKPLLRAGVVPAAVVIVDPGRQEVLKLLEGIDLAPLADTPLIYFPSVHRDVLALWPGPLLTAYPENPLYQDLAEAYPKQRLFSAGSVLHPTLDLAVGMGATEIVLFGADFAFPGDYTHVADAANAQPVARAPHGHWVHNGSGQRIATSPNLRGFLRDLEDYISAHPSVRFVNASRKGAYIKGTVFLEGAS